MFPTYHGNRTEIVRHNLLQSFSSASLQAKLHASISSSKLCFNSLQSKQVLSLRMILNQWSCTWYVVFCIFSGTAPVISGNLLLIRNRSSNFKHLGINSCSLLPDKFAIVHAGNAKLSETMAQPLHEWQTHIETHPKSQYPVV